MSWKFISFILIVLVLILGVFLIYTVSESDGGDSNSEILYVSTEGPFNLDEIISDVENASYYEGYDNETLNWMKSLGNKAVFSGNGYFVVMDFTDAKKLHSEFITDAYITQEFKCNILENHSLGNVKYSRDVLLVSNVEYLNETLTSLQV